MKMQKIYLCFFFASVAVIFFFCFWFLLSSIGEWVEYVSGICVWGVWMSETPSALLGWPYPVAGWETLGRMNTKEGSHAHSNFLIIYSARLGNQLHLNSDWSEDCIFFFPFRIRFSIQCQTQYCMQLKNNTTTSRFSRHFSPELDIFKPDHFEMKSFAIQRLC